MVDAPAGRTSRRGRSRKVRKQHHNPYETRRNSRSSRRRRCHMSTRSSVCTPSAAGIISGCVKKRKRRRKARKRSSDQPASNPQLVQVAWDNSNDGLLFQGENSNGPTFISSNESTHKELSKELKSAVGEKGKGKMTEQSQTPTKTAQEAKPVEKTDEESKPAETQGTSTCGICFTESKERGRLECCDHYFCFNCIFEWSKVESRCPMCKQRFHTIVRVCHPGQPVSRSRTIQIPVKDQVYVPTEEELRNLSDPYANVVCVECHEIGDEGLLLLCDFCDSASHTYCVGLGVTVPRGDWFCQSCQDASNALEIEAIGEANSGEAEEMDTGTRDASCNTEAEAEDDEMETEAKMETGSVGQGEEDNRCSDDGEGETNTDTQATTNDDGETEKTEVEADGNETEEMASNKVGAGETDQNEDEEMEPDNVGGTESD